MNAATRLQDIPPRCARLCLRVERFAREQLALDFQGKTLLVGLSGGADSTALLLIFHFLRLRLGCALRAAHLDHGLRPESGQDAARAAALCAALDIPCQIEAADVRALATARRCGLEEAGRAARYDFFGRALGACGADFVLTAHTLDDLAEDALMRLLRGAGWPGLAGMEAVDPARRLARPLLLTPKRKLLEFLTDLGLAWTEDSSNADPRFLRNRVRHEMLPLFTRENPSFLDAVASLWRLGRIDAAYWDAQTRRALARPVATELPENSAFLDNATLAAADKALRLRLYKDCLESLGPGQPLADALLRLDQAWVRRDLGKTVQLPGDKRARVTRAGIAFFHEVRRHPLEPEP